MIGSRHQLSQHYGSYAGLTSRRALSLIEVILALAILGGAMAMLGTLVRIGARHANDAQDISTAYLHCQSLLGQIAGQALPATPVQNAAVPVDPEWVYSVTVQNLELQALISVRVTVTSASDTSPNAVSASLTRWMIDPVWMEQREAEAAAAAAAEEAEATSDL
jgi:prepilin-type N-terminal cleavage/methylation domain-containing protein